VRWKLSPLIIGACRIRSLRQQRRLHRRIDDRLQNKMQTRRGYLSDRWQVNHAGHEYEGYLLVAFLAAASFQRCIKKKKPRHLGVGKYSSEALVGVLRNHNGRLT